mgnify:CR=1 FL=1
MTTDADVALAVRGALWCGWVRQCDGDPWEGWARGPFIVCGGSDAMLIESPDFFVALLDKCDAEGVRYGVHLGEAHSYAPSGGGLLACRHPNRTVALLLALDAAGILPPEAPAP